MAPPKKPRALKLVSGERKDRINDDEPIPSEMEIVPPEWLSPAALAIWAEPLTGDLIAKKVLTAWDVDAWARLCAARAVFVEAQGHLEDEGRVIAQPVFDRNGRQQEGFRTVRNEWVAIARDAEAEIDRLAGRFGLTPADRGALKVSHGARDADGQAKDPKRLLS